MSIKWEGIDNLLKAVDDFEEQYIRAVKRVVAETATKIQTTAQALAPVGQFDGGNLRKSIELKFEDGGLKAEIIVGAEYGIYVEYGTGIYAEGGDGRKDPWVYWSDDLNRWVWTRGMRSQPYFRPGFEAGLKYFTREMNKLG